MPVLDEDGVDGLWRVERHRAPQMGDTVAKKRVREQANAVELDEHRSVPDVSNDQ